MDAEIKNAKYKDVMNLRYNLGPALCDYTEQFVQIVLHCFILFFGFCTRDSANAVPL